MEVSFSSGINRSKKWAHLVKKYVHEIHPDSEKSLFETIKDLMFFAALLGYSLDKRRPLSDYDDGVEDIQAHTFSTDRNVGIIFAIGLAVKKDSLILKEENEKELLRIFEEYANGGFEILESWQNPADNHGTTSMIHGMMENGFFTRIEDIMEANINEFENFTL